MEDLCLFKHCSIKASKWFESTEAYDSFEAMCARVCVIPMQKASRLFASMTNKLPALLDKVKDKRFFLIRIS